MKTTHGTVLAAAITGLFLGSAQGCASHTQKDAEATWAARQAMLPADIEKHACKGMNSCKGKGGCKPDANECAGKNDCKNKGGCFTVAPHECGGKNDCRGQGGCGSSANGCGGKNECSGKGGCAVPIKK